MISGVLLLWFILTLGSLIFVLWDQLTNTPSLRIMTLAWVLMILYTGPIGLFLYFLTCRQPMPDTHDQFINVHWKQTVGSLIHCVAGDATGIIISAAILHYFSIPNGTEVIIEYIFAYLFGLFIFQALFMKAMYHSYWQAVRKTIFAETVSMNLVMAGMFPIIIALKAIAPDGGDPFNPLFWGIMSLATMGGFIVAYPMNAFLVKRGIKHGMMSRKMPSMEEHHHHEMKGLSFSQSLFYLCLTFAILVFAIWLTSLFTPVTFGLPTEQNLSSNLSMP